MTQRRSLPALNLLKVQHKNKIDNFYQPMKKKVVERARAKKNEEMKLIIKDIENYALKKFPNLSLYLKCESGHSTPDNRGGISVGFKVETSSDAAERVELRTIEISEADDLKALETWYTNFLTACAGGDDLPLFERAHLDSVSSTTPEWINGNDLRI